MTYQKEQPKVMIVKGSGYYPEPEPRVFYPTASFKTKIISYIGIVVVIGLLLCLFVVFLNIESFLEFGLFSYALLGTTTILFLAGVLGVALTSFYVRSFEYQVHGSEIIVRKGLFNVTTKHIPFTNVTNIAIRSGLVDRLLGIGTIEIETAGGSQSTFEPLVKIEGIRIYEEVAYFILGRLQHINSVLFQSKLDHPSRKQENIYSPEFLLILRSIKDEFSK